jgi:pimeloyl-ACP methyl ester carboxylesterase
MNLSAYHLPGALITLPLPGRRRPLDGFWAPGRRTSRTLVLFVHGMGSNFYRSAFKKAVALAVRRAGADILLFDNRGAGRDVATERFRDGLADLDAAARWAEARGYRRFILVGHSTGAQKIIHWASRRRDPRLAGLVLAAVGDDLAIVRRDLGRAYPRWLRRAKDLVRRGRGETVLPAGCLGFTARRWLSIADPTQLEAALFDFEGEMRIFRTVTAPVLALLPEKEEYACIPVPEMARRLAARTRSTRFSAVIVPGADHSFHGCEPAAAAAIVRWMKTVPAEVGLPDQIFTTDGHR